MSAPAWTTRKWTRSAPQRTSSNFAATAAPCATLDAVPLLRKLDLEVLVPAERVKHVCTTEGAVDPSAPWLTEFWAGGRSRAWILFQTSLLHVYGHYFEGLATKGLWGSRSR
jgi:hypothetical protein